jgi:membrane-associated HD superfamily phosphohydrolase
MTRWSSAWLRYLAIIIIIIFIILMVYLGYHTSAKYELFRLVGIILIYVAVSAVILGLIRKRYGHRSNVEKIYDILYWIVFGFLLYVLLGHIL